MGVTSNPFAESSSAIARGWRAAAAPAPPRSASAAAARRAAPSRRARRCCSKSTRSCATCWSMIHSPSPLTATMKLAFTCPSGFNSRQAGGARRHPRRAAASAVSRPPGDMRWRNCARELGSCDGRRTRGRLEPKSLRLRRTGASASSRTPRRACAGVGRAWAESPRAARAIGADRRRRRQPQRRGPSQPLAGCAGAGECAAGRPRQSSARAARGQAPGASYPA